MKTLLPLAAVCLSLALTGCKPPKSSYVKCSGKVLKVYEAKDAGFTYSGYVVDRGGVEIVVTDFGGKPLHKVGDTIEYLDQKIEISGGPKTLHFTLVK